MSHPPAAQDDLAQMRKLFQLALLFIVMVGGGGYAYCEIDRAEKMFKAVKEVPHGYEDKVSKNAFAEMVKQAEQCHGWAALILGGIIAAVITTKVHKVPLLPVAYVLLGLAAVLLVGSLQAGWALKQRHTYFVLINNFSDFRGMNALLLLQTKFLMWAVGSVSIFAAWFLCMIVYEVVKPYDPPGRSPLP
jgi:hypothetical protein